MPVPCLKVCFTLKAFLIIQCMLQYIDVLQHNTCNKKWSLSTLTSRYTTDEYIFCSDKWFLRFYHYYLDCTKPSSTGDSDWVWYLDSATCERHPNTFSYHAILPWPTHTLHCAPQFDVWNSVHLPSACKDISWYKSVEYTCGQKYTVSWLVAICIILCFATYIWMTYSYI